MLTLMELIWLWVRRHGAHRSRLTVIGTEDCDCLDGYAMEAGHRARCPDCESGHSDYL